MARYLSSIFLGSDFDEEATVLAYAYGHNRGVAREKRRQGRRGLGLVGIGLILQVGGRLYQDEIEALGGDARLIGMLMLIGLIALALGALLIVHSWWTNVGPIQALVKGYWRLVALPYSKHAVLMWDTLKAEQDQVATFEMDVGKLQNLAEVVQGTCDSLKDEAALLSALGRVRDALKDVEPTVHPASFVSRESPVHQQLTNILELTEPIPDRTLKTCVVLPARAVGDMQDLLSFADNLVRFLQGPYGKALQWVKEHITKQAEAALKPLGGSGRVFAQEVPTLKPTKAELNGEIRSGLAQTLDRLFGPVLEKLQDEVEPDLERLEQDTKESIERTKTHYESLIQQVQRDKEYAVGNLDREVAQRARDLDEAQAKLQEIRRKLSTVPSAQPLDLSVEPVQVDLQTGIWESFGTTESFSLPPLFTSPTFPTKPLSDLSESQPALPAEQSDLSRARRDVGAAQDALQQARRRRKQAEKQFTDQIRGYEAARQASIKERRELQTKQQQRLRQQIQDVENQRGRLSGLLGQQPGVPNLAILGDLTKAMEGQGRIPLDPEVVTKAIMAHRCQVIEVLRDDIVKATDQLVERLEATDGAVAHNGWDPSGLQEVPAEYLIPIWFIRYQRHKHWQPFLSICDVVTREIQQGEDLGIEIDDEDFYPLLEYVSQELDDDYLAGALSCLAGTGQRKKLLQELMKMVKDKLIIQELCQEIQTTYSMTELLSV